MKNVYHHFAKYFESCERLDSHTDYALPRTIRIAYSLLFHWVLLFFLLGSDVDVDFVFVFCLVCVFSSLLSFFFHRIIVFPLRSSHFVLFAVLAEHIERASRHVHSENVAGTTFAGRTIGYRSQLTDKWAGHLLVSSPGA